MARKHTFQSPRGTRDFYPEDMAIRRHIESVWREVSINHGFDEIEGPMFEHLDLYTVKSGEGIVSELFSFTRAGGETRYALRPEFTPTLARMYAAKAAQLPKPTKWFVIPNHFRAERPQRGRLREFLQWNIDVIGGQDTEADEDHADLEVITCTIDVLSKFGLTPDQVRVRLSSRKILDSWATSAQISPDKYQVMLWAADNFSKLSQEQLHEKFIAAQIDNDDVEKFKDFMRKANQPNSMTAVEMSKELGVDSDTIERFVELQLRLDDLGYSDWWVFDAGIVRGLAYYTGTVFEVIADGERAIAGGGRYDHLIELMGGPSTPAVGIAMGDVVLRLVLEDHGLLPAATECMPRPDVFIIAAKEEGDAALKQHVSALRRAGFHVRHTYRTTRNVGKLLGEAGKARARCAIILGDELQEGIVALKNLETGDQRNIKIEAMEAELKSELTTPGVNGDG